MCYPLHHVTIMWIFVLRFYSNLQTVTAMAVFVEILLLDTSRLKKEAVK
jgi:hypothetical protein